VTNNCFRIPPPLHHGALHFHGRVKEIIGVHAMRECGNSPARVAQTAEGGRALSERRESSHTQKNRSFTTDAASRHIRPVSCRNCEERPRRPARQVTNNCFRITPPPTTALYILTVVPLLDQGSGCIPGRVLKRSKMFDLFSLSEHRGYTQNLKIRPRWSELAPFPE
jgi:hypothetical protein